MSWGNYPRLILDELEELLPKPTPDLKFRPRQHIAVFGEDGIGDVESGGPG
jgi:hypothetical protein